MKLFTNEIELNAKTKMSFALCTVLALSATALRADDYSKDKDQGTPGGDSKTQTGKTASQLSSADEKFVTEACHGGKIEVKMSKLATERAQNAEVKQFAQKMVDDHGKSGTELKQIATSKGCTMPESDEHLTGIGNDADRTQVREKTEAHPNKDMAEFKREWQKLESATGADFDRQYVSMSLKCHEKSVKEFEKASKDAQDPEVKSFAAKTLPTLREHLTQVRSLQSQVGSVGAPGADANTQTGNQSTGPGTSSGTGTGTPQSK